MGKYFISIIILLSSFISIEGLNAQSSKDSSSYFIELDLTRFLYNYRSLDLSFGKELNDDIDIVGDFTFYLGLNNSSVKENNLSGLKAKSSLGNFKLGAGANYYFTPAEYFYIRTRLSYGFLKVEQSRYVCEDIQEEDFYKCICNSPKLNVLTRDMHQLMFKLGLGMDLAMDENVIMSGYIDYGIAQYFSDEIGYIRKDACRIDEELDSYNDFEINFSDGALKLDHSKPINLWQIGLKLRYIL